MHEQIGARVHEIVDSPHFRAMETIIGSWAIAANLIQGLSRHLILTNQWENLERLKDVVLNTPIFPFFYFQPLVERGVDPTVAALMVISLPTVIGSGLLCHGSSLTSLIRNESSA